MNKNNLNYFNANKRKGILTVEHTIEDGDRWKILKDEQILVCNMNLEHLYYAVAAIISYEMRRNNG